MYDTVVFTCVCLREKWGEEGGLGVFEGKNILGQILGKTC